jgi:outer membrane protein assembly factor BamD (BamD/ComL family)
MKKLIFTLIAVLVIVFAALSVLGAGGEYSAEKALYYALKANEAIVMNPDVAPPAQIAAIETRLKALIAKYPDTNSVRTANIGLLEFYITHKKYDEAKSLAGNILVKYKDDPIVSSTAQFLKGVISEKQNNWDRALEEFKILNDRYPNTELGMQIPLYIGRYYDSKGLDEKSKDAYRNAVAFYSKMEEEYSGKMLGYTASAFRIQAYLNLKDYEAAGNALDGTIRKYSSTLSFVQLLPLVEKIYIENLKNPQKAAEIYKYVMSKTKNPKILKFLTKKIKAAEAKK